MAELVILFLLLPLAAASGWWLARRHDRRRQRRDAGSLSRHYFRGLNYLLNEESDKAMELFLELVEVNPDTVETYLALGSLYRRRGEVDRAIRFHKHIITQSGLSEQQRMQALLELGEDYMQAGLLDRAEQLFSELLDQDLPDERAVRQLLIISQQEKDWKKAISHASRLRQTDGRKASFIISCFYCELAHEALEEGDEDQARQHLRQARRHDPGNARTRLLEAELAARNQRWAEAAEQYRQAVELDPDCLSLVDDALEQAHVRAGQEEALDVWLEAQLASHPSTTLILVLARRKARKNPRSALGFLLNHQSRRPTVRGLDYLLELAYQQGVSLDRVGPELIQDMLRRLLDGQLRYRCRHCGFSGGTWHWQCPGCRRWGTTRAITGVLGE